MKKLLALLMAVAVTFQLVTPVFADTEGTEETTAPTEAVVETEAPTEAPTEETTAPTEETSAPTEATEETEEATEETVEDIALFADDGDVIASGECGKNGDNLTWVLTVDGTLTISGGGEMENYTDSSVAPWYSNRTKILSAVVEPGVESVGNYAFYSCLKLASVSLPGGVKSIGESAFQDCAKLTAVENVALPLLYGGVKKAERLERARAALETVGLSDRVEHRPDQLSGGQCQRVAIARAIVGKPKLLLADEPTGALDSGSTDELLRLFADINRAGQTILMVTHSVKAASHAGRVLFIKDGQVFHQLYRGQCTDEQLYQKIADTLTMLQAGGDRA